MRKLNTLLLALATCLPLALAQTPEKKPKLIVQFFAEEYPDKLGLVELRSGDQKCQPFKLSTQFLSEPITAPGRAMDLKLADKDTVLCRINLPEQGRTFAVVLLTAKPAGYNPIIVRTDGGGSFRGGQSYFINRSQKTILGKLGTAPLVLKPGEQTKAEPKGAVNDAYYSITFATREANGNKVFSTTRWPVQDQVRSFVIFYTNSKGQPTFRAVDDYMLAKDR